MPLPQSDKKVTIQTNLRQEIWNNPVYTMYSFSEKGAGSGYAFAAALPYTI